MSAQPTVVATVSGNTGYEVCYISFAEVVALDGALVDVPEVVSQAPSMMAVSEEAISFAGTLNGTTYTAGQVLTFKVTAQGTSRGTFAVDITYETPKRKETVRVLVALTDYEV